MSDADRPSTGPLLPLEMYVAGYCFACLRIHDADLHGEPVSPEIGQAGHSSTGDKGH